MDSETKSQRFNAILGLIIFLGIAIFIGVCMIGGGIAVGSAPAVDPNMVLYYHFNTSTLVDSSINKNNVTLVGSPLYNPTGDFLSDGAWAFNGTNDSMILTDVGLNITGNITIVAWINPNNCSHASNVIFSKANGVNGPNLLLDQDCKLQSYFYGLTDNLISGTAITVPKNTWSFIATTYDGLNMRNYMNGRLYDTDDSSGNWSASSVLPTIGVRAWSGWGTEFNGSIGELIVYNKSLTTKEIWALYYNYYGCYVLNQTGYDTVYGDVTFCSSNFQVNSTNTFLGVFRIGADNLNINLNYANITGNDTGTFIQGTSIQNVSIRNGYIRNFDWGILLNTCNNSNIYNNIFNLTAIGVRIKNSSYINVYNNLVLINMTTEGSNRAGISAYDLSNHINVSFNNITDHPTAIYFNNVSTSIVYKNKLYHNFGFGIMVDGQSNYNLIDNNYIDGADWFDGWNDAIRITGNYNNITNNRIYNETHTGIDMFNCEASIGNSNSHNRIINNTIYNIWQATHIHLCNSSYNYFQDNFLYAFNNSHFSEMQHIILLRGNSTGNLFVNISITGQSRGDLISINEGSDNVFKNFNLTGALSIRYTTRSYNFNNNSFLDLFGLKDYIFYAGTSNGTTNGVLGLTSALFTNGTSICNGSSSNLALNTGQVNITLRPGEECWVLDNDNITYGTVRPYNPFSTSLSKKTLTITNSLTDTVTNIPAYANVLSMGFECKNIKSISGLNNYSCDPTTNELNGNLNLLSGSNYFTIITYSVDQGVCTNMFNGYNSFSPWTVLFAVIGLVVLVSIIGTVVFVVNSYNGETPTSGASLNLDSNLIKVIFIWVLIVAILLILSLVVVGNLCSFS